MALDGVNDNSSTSFDLTKYKDINNGNDADVEKNISVFIKDVNTFVKEAEISGGDFDDNERELCYPILRKIDEIIGTISQSLKNKIGDSLKQLFASVIQNTISERFIGNNLVYENEEVTFNNEVEALTPQDTDADVAKQTPNWVDNEKFKTYNKYANGIKNNWANLKYKDMGKNITDLNINIKDLNYNGDVRLLCASLNGGILPITSEINQSHVDRLAAWLYKNILSLEAEGKGFVISRVLEQLDAWQNIANSNKEDALRFAKTDFEKAYQLCKNMGWEEFELYADEQIANIQQNGSLNLPEKEKVIAYWNAIKETRKYGITPENAFYDLGLRDKPSTNNKITRKPG